jgi:hypothetical protein
MRTRPACVPYKNRSACCGTMQLPEFQVVDTDKLASRGPLDDDDILAAELSELSRAFKKSSKSK